MLFQATLPGIEEEICYRGIMLGLLSTVLVSKWQIARVSLYNPAIWIVAILFGIIHALKFDSNWNLAFNLIYFTKTFALGFIWGWMTIKTKSILLPMISHNLSNTIPNLVGMLK